MNNMINQTSANYCTKEFNVDGLQIVNAYKCNGRKFISSDLWTIQRNKKQFIASPSLNSVL